MFKKVFASLFILVGFAVASVNQQGIEFKPVKKTFNKSEEVCFYIKNNTDTELYLPSSAPWAVFEDSKFDKIVFSPVATQSIVRLEPSQKKQWCWKQKDFNDEQVPSGEYTIRLTVFKNGERLFLTSMVEIKNSQ
ncbi:hypothetical protein [Persephonella sp.]|nr:hypothetical protein [Aquificota bacterium]